jgi:thioredoxin
MISSLKLSLFLGFLWLASCNGQSGSTTSLPAKEFAEKLRTTPGAVVLDVRTPGEFQGGHLKNAVNVDWNGSEFEKSTSSWKPSTPLYVYCLAGSRSAAAARNLRSRGYTNVVELEGGMMKWRAAGLPESSDASTEAKGMSTIEYTALVTSGPTVLVDVYAEWCGPCKKMKPFLEELAKERASSMKLVRIDADEHPNLCRELGIDALPVLMLYKNGVRTWQHVGFLDKAGIAKQLK